MGPAMLPTIVAPNKAMFLSATLPTASPPANLAFSMWILSKLPLPSRNEMRITDALILKYVLRMAADLPSPNATPAFNDAQEQNKSNVPIIWNVSWTFFVRLYFSISLKSIRNRQTEIHSKSVNIHRSRKSKCLLIFSCKFSRKTSDCSSSAAW